MKPPRPRVAPIIGATGIDFGRKRAITFAFPENQPILIQEDDETPPLTCPCPDGVPDPLYLTPSTNGDFDSIKLFMIDSCHWCGFDSDSEDDAHKWEIIIEADIGDGTCGWGLIVDDRVTEYFKPWDDGNPFGDYANDSEFVLTIAASGTNPSNFPC